MKNSIRWSAIAILALIAPAFAKSPKAVQQSTADSAASPDTVLVLPPLICKAAFGPETEGPTSPTIIPASWSTVDNSGSAGDKTSDPCPLVREYAECPSCVHLWARAEYLLWWLNGSNLPPLVTTSPPGTTQRQAGVLGAPGTAVLFGDSHVNGDARSGGEITLGGWLGCDQCLGIEGSFFITEARNAPFNANSTGNPILARPFTDVTTGLPSSELIAFPGVVAGSINVNDVSRQFLGADLLFRKHVCCGCNYFVDAVAGYRYLYYSQGIDVTEDLTSTRPSNVFPFIPFGTNLVVGDHFGTRNSFNGFDMGLTGEYRRGNWSVEWLAKLALGETYTALDINGVTIVTVPGLPPVTNAGGLLALSSNSGHFTRERFSVVPELRLRLGYDLTSHIRTTVGYSILWWNGIGDAADAINLNVNPHLLPPVVPPVAGPASPALLFGKSTLIGQGIELGVEYRF